MKWPVRGLWWCLAVLVLCTGCQSKLIYYPRPYPQGLVAKWETQSRGKVLAYRTRDGQQQAYLLRPAQKAPARLWIVFVGNGTLALEWSDWLRKRGPAEDAYLLIDYPAYGACEGRPSPAAIRRTAEAVVPVAMAEFGWSLERDRGRLRFFGHSLGGAAALIAAEVFDIRRGIVVSTFTSMMDMARVRTGLPIGFLILDRYNNVARLKELAHRGVAKVCVFHGSEDESIPVRMAAALRAAAPSIVQLQIIPGGHHNTMQEDAGNEMAAAMRGL